MNTFIDRQLALVRYQEMLQEAAAARAERKAQRTNPNPITRKIAFVLATVLPLSRWITWTVVKR